jgi:2-dehydropantoate 2-reductase
MESDISEKSPRFAIVGAGGVGGYLFGKVAGADLNACLIARSNFTNIAKDGFTLESVDETIKLPSVQVYSSIKEVDGADIVFLTTKTYDIDKFIEQIPEEIAKNSAIITFQNGIDADLRIKQAIPSCRVYPGLAYIISSRTSPTVVSQTAGPCRFIIGDRNSGINEELQNIATLLHSAGIDISCSPQIEKELWKKYVWILAFAGVTGVCRSAIGPIVNDNIGMNLFERCVDESLLVAQAVGVKLNNEDRASIIDKAIGYKTKGIDSKSSLLVDMLNGRRTEIEALHGTVVQIAQRLNIDTPVLGTIYKSIQLGHERMLEKLD